MLLKKLTFKYLEVAACFHLREIHFYFLQYYDRWSNIHSSLDQTLRSWVGLGHRRLACVFADNINHLSKIFKQFTERGNHLSSKIQRYKLFLVIGVYANEPTN